MKSKKLSLNKFKITELSNPSKILGGGPGDETGNDTVFGGEVPKCKENSDVYQ